MDAYDPMNVAKNIFDAIQSAQKNMTVLNVMVLGKTGVGKSTLINNLFKDNMAETGLGRPVSTDIRMYQKDGVPLRIYDSPGLELDGEHSVENLLSQVKNVIKTGNDTGDINNAIHCLLYCVNSLSRRFEPAERSFIEQFVSETGVYNIPVIIVMTQSYLDDSVDFKREIEKENLPVAQIVRILAADQKISADYVAKAFGLDHLSDIMESVVPEAVKKTMTAMQKANIDQKVKKAHAVVSGSAIAAAATGASPIPFSDAALLIPEQISMLAGITAVFGLPIEKSTLAAILSSTIGTMGATVLGKTVVSNLVKLIPGAGSVIGGVISGSTAAALTTALGEAYIAIMKKIATGEIDASDLATEKGKELISTMFTDRLKIKRKKNGQPEE